MLKYSILEGESQILPESSLAELLLESLRDNRHLIALSDGEKVYTYDSLHQASVVVASALMDAGVGQNDIVITIGNRSAEQVAFQLGAILLGAVPFPIDLAMPPAILKDVFSQAICKVALSTTSISFDINLIQISPFEHMPSNEPSAFNDGLVNRDRTTPAQIFTSSGTSGPPKMVITTQAGIINEALWTKHEFMVNAGTIVGWTRSPAFSVSRWELWSYLLAGAQIAVAPNEAIINAESLLNWSNRNSIEVMFVGTGIAHALAGLPWPQGICLRILLTGGDSLRLWPEVPVTCAYYNTYGVTEVSSVRTYHKYEGADDDVNCIGKPIANTVIYVLDEELNPVQPGDVGEIYIGGVGIDGGGYIGSIKKETPFRISPFNQHATLYKTSDLAYIDPISQNIVYCGRKDGLTFFSHVDGVMGSARISLQRVEVLAASLVGHDQIVAVNTGADTEPKIIVFVSGAAPAEDIAILTREMPKHLLPIFLPTRYEVIKEIPLNLNGKVDRRSLLRLSSSHRANSAGSQAR